MSKVIFETNKQNDSRTRTSVDISALVMSHLEHISEVTGLSKSVIINQALLDSLPDLIARADAIKKRGTELKNTGKGKR